MFLKMLKIYIFKIVAEGSLTNLLEQMQPLGNKIVSRWSIVRLCVSPCICIPKVMTLFIGLYERLCSMI